METSHVFLLLLGLVACPGLHGEFTEMVFGRSDVDGVPAAFGDFNSDELTDIFLLRENFHTIQVMLGAETEPLLHEGPKCAFSKFEITGVVPGDFDGDAYMDVLFTVRMSRVEAERDMLAVYINWGGGDTMNCTAEDALPLLQITGEPMVLDYDDNMIMDLFALDKEGKRTYYIFNKDRTPPSPIQISDEFRDKKCRVPHSHAFLDFNGDFTADLVLSGEKSFEVWNGVDDQTEFKFHDEIQYPADVPHLGQSLFLDVELKGKLNLVLPVCQQDNCVGSSSILVYAEGSFRNLHIDLKDPENKVWGFMSYQASKVDFFGRDTITLRGGDYNMDGYPDLIATLVNGDRDYQTVLLENVPCSGPICQNPAMSRTFAVQWNALAPTGKKTIMGAFYDFYQDGILDVVMVKVNEKNEFNTVAHRNSLDYDSNFVKVIVLTGLTNPQTPPPKLSPMGRRKKTYGTNMPGPRVAYYTTNQEGDQQNGTSAQIPQSAYFALQLPYSVFGLGRTPNFVDTLQVGMCNRSREWKQIIPNSQMIVVPRPVREPSQWKAQLFVTPSKLIVMSTIALGGTCFIIMLIILVLHIKEKREDKLEKLQEAHRFHFDAM